MSIKLFRNLGAATMLALTFTGCAHAPQGMTAEQEAALQAMKMREAEVAGFVNNHRQEKGLPLLVVSGYVSAIARQHSQRMADGLVPLGHDGFGDRSGRIMAEFTYREIGENVNFGDSTTAPTNVVRGWLSLPQQRAEVEGNYDLTGVGVARDRKGTYYYTQIYILRGKKK